MSPKPRKDPSATVTRGDVDELMKAIAAATDAAETANLNADEARSDASWTRLEFDRYWDRFENVVEFFLDVYEEWRGEPDQQELKESRGLTLERVTEARETLRVKLDRRPTRAELAAELHTSEKTLSRVLIELGLRQARPRPPTID